VRSRPQHSQGSQSTAATTPGEEETTAQPGLTNYSSNNTSNNSAPSPAAAIPLGELLIKFHHFLIISNSNI
jgi:hypothetical protein